MRAEASTLCLARIDTSHSTIFTVLLMLQTQRYMAQNEIKFL